MSEQLQHLPIRVREALETAKLRIQNPEGAQYLWERVMTPAQRKRLGNNLEAAYQGFGGTIGIWHHLRGGKPLRAIVDAAHALNLLSESDSRWLVRELDESNRPRESPADLEWCKEQGELRLNGEIIRRVRIGIAKNLVPILDDFQECAWPEQMDDPLPPSTDINRLRGAVKVLNRGLQGIRFFADGTGEGIRWAVAIH